MRTAAVQALILICAAHLAQAQVVGQRVRVLQHAGATLVGVVVERDDSLLAIQADGAAGAMHQIPFANMQTLSVSLGIDSYAKGGLWAGGGLGGLLTVAICSSDCNAREYIIVGILSTALLGFGGAKAGAAITRERWTTIPVPIPGSGAALAPTIRLRPAGTPALGFTLTF